MKTKIKTTRLLLFLLMISTGQLVAQKTYNIQGIIYNNEENEVLPNATIRSSNGGISTIADGKGHFILPLAQLPDSIIITHNGFETTIVKVENNTALPLLIYLKKNINQLEDVIVNTGYQSLSKERATGSFYNLDSTILNQRVTTNIMDRLDGITSSLLVDKRNTDGYGTQYQVRGLSTLTAAIQSPLIILDNFPYEGDINNINPNDVDNITILKDAAATSIWGARAGNGVIVITTKKPKRNQPVQIAFNSNITITQQPDLFSIPQIPVKDQIELEKYLFDKNFYDWRFTDPFQTPVPAAVEILNNQRSGFITQAEAQRQLDSLSGNDVRTDMQKYLYRTELKSQTAISLSGASDKIRYLFSAGYDKNNYTLRGNGDERYTLRTDNLFDINKNWQFQAGVLFTKSNNESNSPGGYGNYRGTNVGLSPYSRLVDVNGDPAAVDLYMRGVFTDTAGAGKLLDWKYRPLQQLAVNDISSKITDILFNLGSNYKILPWLSADVKYQYQQSFQKSSIYKTIDDYFARDLINTFTQINGPSIKYPVPLGGNLYTTENTKTAQSIRGQLNINKRWKTIHELTSIIGAELRDAKTDAKASAIYGINGNTLTTQTVDYTTEFPAYDDIRSPQKIPDGINLNKYVSRFVSLYGNASYTYKNKYTLYGSGRRDASNIFGVKSNQKWMPLWSVGGLWKISEERFFNVESLPVLNFRISYGASGNIDPTTSALLVINYRDISSSPYGFLSAAIQSPQNDELRWEKVKTFNTGLDFASVNNRVSGSIEYYKKNSVDLISIVTLDPTVGYSNMNLNAASIKGKGIDIVLNTLNVNRAFVWQTNFLFSYVDYKVEKYPYKFSEAGLITSGTLFPIVGYNPYAIIVYKWAGLDPQTGDPMGYVDGVPSKDYDAISNTLLNQKKIYSSALPPFFGSLRNTITYKKVSLAFNIVYKLGYYFLRPSLNYSELLNNGFGAAEYVNRWQKPGDEAHTNIPSMIYPANSNRDNFYNRTSINVEKGDHIRFQDIFLSYDVDSKAQKKILKNGQVYLYCNQLNWLLWRANNEGLDPDVLYNVKPSANVSLGIKLNF